MRKPYNRFLPVIGAISLCSSAASAQGIAVSRCAPLAPHDGYAVTLRKNIIRQLNSPTEAAARFKLTGATPADTSVRIVTTDSLCNRAADAMRVHQPTEPGNTVRPDSTSFDQVFLISVGTNRFLAEGIPVGGVWRSYVLDSSLTTVLTSWEKIGDISSSSRWTKFATRQLPLPTLWSWGTPGLVFPDLTRCASPTEANGHLGDQREWLAQLVGDSTERSFLRKVSLPFMRDPQVSIVSDHTLCTLAARTINRDHKLPPSAPHVIFLLKIGKHRYWAETDDLEAGEWGIGFILDEKLKKVKARAAI